jgi:O-antigen ligase
VLAGIAIVDVYSLATRLFPTRLGSFDPTAEYRLAAPVGYWNGLGILAVVGLAIAIGLVARGRSPLTRGLAALTLPIVFTTLYFTFSRGSWLALAAAAVVMLAVDTRRLQLVTVAGVTLVPTAAAAWYATRQAALGTKGAELAAAAHQGRHVAIAVAIAAVAGAVIAVAACLVEERLAIPQRGRQVYAAVLTTGAVAAAVLGLIHVGGPAGAAQRAWHSFTTPPTSITAGQSESKRLFSLSSNGRIALWKGALRESSAHPLLGGGAGSYESWWLQHRKVPERVKDAHSLYLQTLAELGPLGLALLALALAVPLAAAIRSRRRPLVPFAVAAYAAFLLHAAVDWNWQLPGVTLPAVLCGAMVLVAGRTDEEARLGTRVRVGTAGAACAVAIAAFFILLGNVPLTKAGSAADAARWSDSAREARKAARWLPWSAEPWRLIGEADLAVRDRPGARVALRKAISRDPGNWHLWFDLSAAEHGRAAAQALATASRLNPLSPEIAQTRALKG